MNKTWKIIFYFLLILFTMDLGLQIYAFYRYYPHNIIHLIASWDKAKQTLGWYTLSLLVVNALVYKFPAFGTSRNQISDEFLACSVLALLYYSVSNMLLPYIYFSQLGQLEIFLVR